MEDVTVEEKHDATFECQLSKTNVDVTWYFKGKKVTKGDKYHMESIDVTYRITIKDCSLDDATDSVSITHKDAKSTAKLIVTGKLKGALDASDICMEIRIVLQFGVQFVLENATHRQFVGYSMWNCTDIIV